MVGLNKISAEKVKFVGKLIEKGLPKFEIKEKFILKFKCHQSTFYDWYDFTYFGRYSGRVLNHRNKQNQYINNRIYFNEDKEHCYFCSVTENLNEAHVVYIPKELIIILCRSCHTKYDRLGDAIKQRKNNETPPKKSERNKIKTATS